ncbi:MAG TPA: response regulator [Polyangiaceae bacterium]|nr:response regulator [Polyangiaceae bacterium]
MSEANGGPAATGEARTAPLILLVDDFQDNREMYAEYFGYFDFRVVEAANGIEALEKAFDETPDVVIMDLSLPGMDGWEATRRLKNDPRTKKVPVIALTGHALAGHSKGARDAGCDAFVAKPCLPEKLLEEVRRLLAASAASGKSRPASRRGAEPRR